MQIADRVSAPAGDTMGNLAGRQASQVGSSAREDAAAIASAAGYLDSSSRVSLSADALLYLGRAKRTPERFPALTQDEWSNRPSSQLLAREYQAFGKYIESGNYKGYYRAFIEYYDSLRSEDQNSLRYFGTREAAVAGLRSIEYENGPEEVGDLPSRISVFLDAEKSFVGRPAEEAGPAATGFGWDSVNISYEASDTASETISSIDRLYAESY
ncbi:biotin biosynthesis protein BioC [Ensifer soli]|uniref:biotin biosynthesis protein BioC n=1 Tax=Ciceribacter sp. sgz301302 TaxID=3342379 RepID=UPI0035B737D5